MQCVSTLGFARVDVRGARTLPGCGCLQRDVSSLRNSLLFSLSNEGFKLRRPYSDELEVIVELMPSYAMYRRVTGICVPKLRRNLVSSSSLAEIIHLTIIIENCKLGRNRAHCFKVSCQDLWINTTNAPPPFRPQDWSLV